MGELHEMQIPAQWTCPRCGSQLANAEAPHACGIYSATTLFSSSEPQIYALFLRLEEMAALIGDVTVFPQRTHIDFLAGGSGGCPFASVEARGDFMAVGFHFRQREDHTRFAKIEEVALGEWLHSVRVDHGRDLDEAFTGWLERAYQEASGG